MTTQTMEGFRRVFTPAVEDLFYRVVDTALGDESGYETETILGLATGVATHRAELLGRGLMPIDVEFVLSMFCKWPFKPPPPDDYREWVDQHLSPALVGKGDPYALQRAIPNVSLLLSIETLHQLLARGGGRMLFS